MNNNFNQTQYDQNAAMYIESNPDGSIGEKTPAERVALVHQYLPAHSSIFEVGAGNGIDSQALTEADYKVTATDFSQAFLNILKSKNLEVQYFDVLTDTPPSNYECIYANAVFVHIGPEDLKDFLLRCKENSDAQILFATFLKGSGSERSARGRGFERDFFYYQEEDLKVLCEEVGMQIKHLETVGEKWIWLLAAF